MSGEIIHFRFGRSARHALRDLDADIANLHMIPFDSSPLDIVKPDSQRCGLSETFLDDRLLCAAFGQNLNLLRLASLFLEYRGNSHI